MVVGIDAPSVGIIHHIIYMGTIKVIDNVGVTEKLYTIRYVIPLVEAMMQECAVVASDIPVFHEVCGDAALYFNPLDISDIQLKMNCVMHTTSLREQLIMKGKQQVKLFS